VSIAAGTSRVHPLAPLGAEEIRRAAAAVRRAHPELRLPRFSLIALHEPPKDAVRAGQSVPREALVVVLDRADGATYEAVVRVRDEEVMSWTRREGVQPAVLLEEIMALPEILSAHPDVRAALRARGIADDAIVQFDPWTSGGWPIDGVDSSRRLICSTAYVRDHPLDNGYAHPVGNLVAIVDVNAREVVRVIDLGPVAVPSEPGNYDANSVGELRDDLRPLEISQPEGVSFQIDGSEIRWGRWRLRASLHPVDGLVLHDIGFRDGDRVRTIVYRASLAEMVVPYGDPDETFSFRNVFDAGEYHLGKMCGSLALGCDCLGEIRYLDAVLADDDGEPYTVANAICVHEEDDGILWKHWDFRYTERSEVRRARRLIVSSIATVGNYEYGFYWSFHLDGTIKLEVKLTGILQTKAMPAGERSPHGRLVAPQLDAPHHQHLFSVRLDMEVDGTANAVFERDVVGRTTGPGNAYGNAIEAHETLIERECDGARDADPLRQRVWRIVNRGVRNRMGEPVAYRLEPHAGPLLLADPEQLLARRAGFARHHLWVTRHDPRELHAAGDHPNQSAGGDGLPAYVAADRELADADVVLWHTFGVSHVARLEDWPVMPVESVAFMLRADGFFDRNPALDVPPPNGHCHS
jgi:primary-amine oxidase